MIQYSIITYHHPARHEILRSYSSYDWKPVPFYQPLPCAGLLGKFFFTRDWNLSICLDDDWVPIGFLFISARIWPPRYSQSDIYAFLIHTFFVLPAWTLTTSLLHIFMCHWHLSAHRDVTGVTYGCKSSAKLLCFHWMPAAFWHRQRAPPGLLSWTQLTISQLVNYTKVRSFRCRDFMKGLILLFVHTSLSVFWIWGVKNTFMNLNFDWKQKKDQRWIKTEEIAPDSMKTMDLSDLDSVFSAVRYRYLEIPW